MTYSITIIRNMEDPSYINDIKSWGEVLSYLKEKLSFTTTSVNIFKFSSDSKCLGHKLVTIGNFYSVITSKNDKILK